MSLNFLSMFLTCSPEDCLDSQDILDRKQHVTISYDITGDSKTRDKVDAQIKKHLESDFHLAQKMKIVNTTIYWRADFTELKSKKTENLNLETEVRKLLKSKIDALFVNKSDPAKTTVDVFCMVGNYRAFTFENVKV